MKQNAIFTNPFTEPFYLQVRPNGESCNVYCKYCRYEPAEITWTGKPQMLHSLLEKVIKEQINAQPSKDVVFVWEGGEPMLSGMDFFRDAVRLQKSLANDKIVFNVMETNGLLIDGRWCEFFKENNFFISVFLDGPEHCHSYYCNDRKNGKTFSKAIDAISLLKKHRIDFVVQVEVTQYSVSYPLEIYHFLKSLGVHFMRFTPLFHRIIRNGKKIQVLFPYERHLGEQAKWSVPSLAYGKFLTTIFDEWVRNDVGERFIKIFDATLTLMVGKRSLEICDFAKSCRGRLLVDFDGSVYQCSHYVSPKYKLGDLKTQSLLAVAHSQQRAALADAKLEQTSSTCKACDMLPICNGFCTKSRTDSISGDDYHSYYCEGLKHYFNYVKPYMDFMANELQNNRPPVNVMEYAKSLDKS